MAFDGIVTTAVTKELSDRLTGGRIDKIYQPSPDEIFMNIHCGSEKYRLYLSANTNHAGVYLTEEKSVNPQNPPGFCMLLRKHLQSARIREIRQVDSERIVEIFTDAVNELGFSVKHRLVIEIMGKHSNILLVDIFSGKIVDCIKRISVDVSRYRQTLPGLAYISPPSHGKISYFGLTYPRFEEAVLAAGFTEEPEKALVKAIAGISPAIASEIIFRAEHSGGSLLRNACDELLRITSAAADGRAEPLLYLDESGAPADFHVVPFLMYETSRRAVSCRTVSEACEKYFEGRTSSNRIRQKSQDMRRSVTAHLDRLLLKKQRLSEDLLQAENSEKYRLYGELLTASLHSVREGRNSAEVLNYYTGEMMSIPLDSRYSAAKNAQRYFKKYSKAKTAVVEKKIQLEETEREITYLNSVLTFIDNAENVEDLEDIRSELIESGILRRKNTKEKPRRKKMQPVEYILSSGKRVLVGRNNRENDILTFRTASPKDIWFHAKDIPGSHAVLFTEGKQPEDSDIYETAAIAAFHSKARLSGNVPVDYVRIKYVKKPNGARPGYVIFTNNNTVYVDPKRPQQTEK